MKRIELICVTVAGVLVATGGLANADDVATKMSDQQITQHVKDKLANDEPTVAPRILVTVEDGVVTLMGRQLTPEDINTAIHDAKSTDGVVRVESRLKMG